MRLRFKPLDDTSARAALTWRHEGPYAFYHADETDRTEFVIPTGE